MNDSLVKQRAEESTSRERWDMIGQSLRRAFPMTETGTFAGLLDAIDEANLRHCKG